MGEELSLERVKMVKAMYESALMAKANVVGVGIGWRQGEEESTGGLVIVVSVTHKVPRSELDPGDVIPSELEGVPVDIQAIGELWALPDGQ